MTVVIEDADNGWIVRTTDTTRSNNRIEVFIDPAALAKRLIDLNGLDDDIDVVDKRASTAKISTVPSTEPKAIIHG